MSVSLRREVRPVLTLAAIPTATVFTAALVQRRRCQRGPRAPVDPAAGVPSKGSLLSGLLGTVAVGSIPASGATLAVAGPVERSVLLRTRAVWRTPVDPSAGMSAEAAAL